MRILVAQNEEGTSRTTSALAKRANEQSRALKPKRRPLHPNAIPSRPWTHISVDMVTGLPRCNGQDAILMIVDRFSKEIIPIACTTELSSEGWAKILRDEVYAKHGMPQVVISDRGHRVCFQVHERPL